jgi:hypothetical protein
MHIARFLFAVNPLSVPIGLALIGLGFSFYVLMGRLGIRLSLAGNNGPQH